MPSRFLSAALLLAAGALLQGCESWSFQTTLPPRAEAHPGIQGLRYSFAEVRVNKTWPTGNFGGQPLDIVPVGNDAYWRSRLTEVAVRRHPALFTKDAPSVPLRLSIDAKVDDSEGASFTAYLCTLCVLGGVLPVPVYSDADIAVRVSAADSGTRAAAFDFKRENRKWRSILTPLALIPYPAHSDFPRSTVVLVPPEDELNAIYDYALESVVEGVVRTLEKDPGAFGKRLSVPRPPDAPALPGTPDSVPDSATPADSHDTIPI